MIELPLHTSVLEISAAGICADSEAFKRSRLAGGNRSAVESACALLALTSAYATRLAPLVFLPALEIAIP